MRDFIAEQDRALLERHGLADFDALWALQLDAVDEPNTERGGYSTVSRLELEGQAYYLKRQSNHLARSLAHPFGEPTFAREWRNIRLYRERGIPALEAVYFAARKLPGEYRAILLSRALDGWTDLDSLLPGWEQRPATERAAIIESCGRLAARVHAAGLVHGCFYPKHIFLRARQGAQEACLIDLEKTRALRFGRRDRVRDIEPLLRRAWPWSEAEVRLFLQAYLGAGESVDAWLSRLSQRKRSKEVRR